MNDLQDINDQNELLRAADPTQSLCNCCGLYYYVSQLGLCSFCNRDFICSDCLTWYLTPNASEDAKLLFLVDCMLPLQYRPYYKLIDGENIVGMCKICSVSVETLFIKDIPISQIPKFINFHFLHEQNKALLLERASNV
jgi:hypothetical protein